MTSKPRLSAFFIDCAQEDWDEGVRFWGEAFQIEPRAGSDDSYLSMPGAIPGIHVELQRIGSESRYHVDFEAEDVEAEVSRFETLGATRVAQIESWWVLRAPTGHLFCVVPIDH